MKCQDLYFRLYFSISEVCVQTSLCLPGSDLFHLLGWVFFLCLLCLSSIPWWLTPIMTGLFDFGFCPFSACFVYELSPGCWCWLSFFDYSVCFCALHSFKTEPAMIILQILQPYIYLYFILPSWQAQFWSHNTFTHWPSNVKWFRSCLWVVYDI